MDALPIPAHAHHPEATARLSKASRSVLYCRAPGLLALAARQRQSPQQQASPIVISEGRTVRDACALALAHGVRVGASLVQARRLCPSLLAVPVEAVDVRALRHRFLDRLADISSVVEPSGPDAAYADSMGAEVEGAAEALRERVLSELGLVAVIGIGVSRLAAQACAESGVSLLADAGADWLWPDDPAVPARLKRLGLGTFGQVAEVGEEALRLHFGKIAPVLHRHAQGYDLTPVRALYPPPSADVILDCSEAPIADRSQLDEAISRVSVRAACQLQGLGVGRRLILELKTERGEARQEWVVPAPLEHAADIQRASWRVLAQMRLMAPITCVRLLVEDVSFPIAHTADLFGAQSDSVTLEATRRQLAARFGLTTLTILGKRPSTAREKRRAAVRENVEAFGRATA